MKTSTELDQWKHGIEIIFEWLTEYDISFLKTNLPVKIAVATAKKREGAAPLASD